MKRVKKKLELDLIAFLEQLRSSSIAYKLDQVREDGIMVFVVVPGERWEVEFMTDGTVEVEVFKSGGMILDGSSLERLFCEFSDTKAAKKE